MKHRILYSYSARFAFLIIAGITAGVILQIQALIQIPTKIRRAFN